MGAYVFVTGLGQSTAPARYVCAGCSVLTECRTAAIAGDEDGIWAGPAPPSAPGPPPPDRVKPRSLRWRYPRSGGFGRGPYSLRSTELVTRSREWVVTSPA
jgi:hypothetical protein